MCRSKHVEPSINSGIINSIAKLHLVGISTELHFFVLRKPQFLMLALLRKVQLYELLLFHSVQKARTLNTYCKRESVMQVNRNCRRHFNIREASASSCARSLEKNICGNWFFVRYYQRFCWQFGYQSAQLPTQQYPILQFQNQKACCLTTNTVSAKAGNFAHLPAL